MALMDLMWLVTSASLETFIKELPYIAQSRSWLASFAMKNMRYDILDYLCEHHLTYEDMRKANLFNQAVESNMTTAMKVLHKHGMSIDDLSIAMHHNVVCVYDRNHRYGTLSLLREWGLKDDRLD